MLWHVVNRVRQVRLIDSVLVATTDLPEDDAILDFCVREGVSCTRGSATDVLDRYLKAAHLVNADVVVRVTGDCPLWCPQVGSRVVRRFLKGGYDYVSNVFPWRTWPDGLDTEVMSMATLKLLWEKAQLPSDREHVTQYLHTHPDEFRFTNEDHWAQLCLHRWTVDTAGDLAFMRSLYPLLPNDISTMPQTLKAIRRWHARLVN